MSDIQIISLENISFTSETIEEVFQLSQASSKSHLLISSMESILQRSGLNMQGIMCVIYELIYTMIDCFTIRAIALKRDYF